VAQGGKEGSAKKRAVSRQQTVESLRGALSRERALRKQALERERETLEQQTATAEILKVIASSPSDVQPVFDAIVKNAGRLASGSSVNVTRIADDHLHLAAYTRISDSADEALRNLYPFRIAAAPGVREAVETRAPSFIADFETDARVTPKSRAVMRARGFRSTLYVPIVRHDAVLGMMHVSRAEPGPFPEQWGLWLKTFADQAAIAIENVRLFNETNEALERQTATSEILRVISNSPADLQPVFAAIARNFTTLCGAVFGSVYTVADGLVHYGASSAGFTPEQERAHRAKYPVRIDDPSVISARTVFTRVVVHVDDVLSDPHYDPQRAKVLGVRRIVGVPMLRDGVPLGSMVGGWSEPGATPKHHENLLKTFADQAVIAIENTRLFNETKEALEHQQASADILRIVSQSVADSQPAFEAILAAVRRLFVGFDATVWRVEGDRLIAVARGGPTLTRATGHGVPITRDYAQAIAILERRPVRIDDVASSPELGELSRQDLLSRERRAVLLVPFVREGDCVGAISVSRNEPYPFSEKQVALLRTFADQAVIAIENARLFREIQEKSAQLETVNRQLEIADKHKSEFLANMSHELRTPLNAIIGFSEVMMEQMFGELNPKQAEYIADIQGSGRHLLSLINDILDLSKIEAGRMELEVSEFDLPDLLESTMTLLRERAMRHGIALGLDVAADVSRVRADARKVKQVVLNLLSNAVKFTPDGGSVRVDARRNGNGVEVSVADTGPGITPEQHALVFEEFRQVGSDQARRAEGTGLGLALVKKFVELHGGTVHLKSALGSGATFTFTLPVARPIQ
jgi:signal transduction histidine kinase